MLSPERLFSCCLTASLAKMLPKRLPHRHIWGSWMTVCRLLEVFSEILFLNDTPTIWQHFPMLAGHWNWTKTLFVSTYNLSSRICWKNTPQHHIWEPKHSENNPTWTPHGRLGRGFAGSFSSCCLNVRHIGTQISKSTCQARLFSWRLFKWTSTHNPKVPEVITMKLHCFSQWGAFL